MSRLSTKVIPPEVDKNYLEEEKKFTSRPEWKRFARSERKFLDVAREKINCFDYRYNATHWGFDVMYLTREASYSLIWMKAYADHFIRHIKKGEQPSNADFHVDYFASDCITRISSCRDKIALMVWAYFCPFNPENREEVLVYHQVRDRIKYPLKYGLKLNAPEAFVKYLDLLGEAHFSKIKKYRDLKVHRREPRIEIYGVKSFHDWEYMLPVHDLSKAPPGLMTPKVKEMCTIEGVLFDQKKLKNRLWSYKDIKGPTEKCVISILKAGDGCFRTLMRRKPFRGRIKK